jgi:hypothetical protein
VGYGMDGKGFDYWYRQENFLYSAAYRPTVKPIQHNFYCVLWVKLPCRVADRSIHVQGWSSYTFILSRVFVVMVISYLQGQRYYLQSIGL